MRSAAATAASPNEKPVGASSVSLGEWLMSPGGALEGLGSPGQHVSHQEELNFSPGMFSPTKGTLYLPGQNDSRSSAHFSPSLFSPDRQKQPPKKRHHIASPHIPGFGNAAGAVAAGAVPSSSQGLMYHGMDLGMGLLAGPVGSNGHHQENLYGTRDRKRRAFHEEDLYDIDEAYLDSAAEAAYSSGSASRGGRRGAKQNRRSSPTLFSPTKDGSSSSNNNSSSGSSSSSGGGGGGGVNTVSPTDPAAAVMRCNCKKSKCLKLYCECFAGLRYCQSCNCVDCNNNEAHELKRQDAIRTTKDRNVTAFQTKVLGSGGHATGCNCKNSMCLKKYCECFQGGAFCANNCKCASCQNFEGSALHAQVKSAGDGKRRKGSPNSVMLVSQSNTPSEQVGIDYQALASGVTPIHAAALMARRPPVKEEPVLTETRAGLRSSRRHSDVSATTSASKESSSSFSSAPGSEDVRSSLAVSATPAHASAASTAAPLPQHKAQQQPHSRKTVSFSQHEQKAAGAPPTYAFFGATHPAVPKAVALQCIDFLQGKDMYNLSVVNSLWAAAVTDESLWEDDAAL